MNTNSSINISIEDANIGAIASINAIIAVIITINIGDIAVIFANITIIAGNNGNIGGIFSINPIVKKEREKC